MADRPSLHVISGRHKRVLDTLTSVKFSQKILQTAAAPASRQFSESAFRHHRNAAEEDAAQDGFLHLDDYQQDTEMDEPGQSLTIFTDTARDVPTQQGGEETDLFDSLRQDLHASYLECLAANRYLQHERKAAFEGGLQKAIAAIGSLCSNCGSGELCEELLPAVSVLWVGSAYRFELLVPRWHCGACQHTFSARPTQLSCLPATAVQGWDLTRVPHGGRAIWFDIDLLQAVDTEMCVIKRQSMDRRCDVLLRVHDYTGCSSIALSYDTLRKRLAEAVREYGYLMAAHTDYRALGVSEYPEGLLSDCGGCWKAAQASSQESSKPLHSLYIDFSFKLNHLSRADVVGDVWERGSRVPPFSRFFIQDGEVLRHLREPVATTSVDETPHVCSDFKADEVLGRRPGGKNDITALGVCLCRHGHIAYLMNAFTGERHAYATLFVKAVLGAIWMLLFVWYDINCRWAHSFLKWLATQGQRAREKAAQLQFPLPRMHYYAHRPECQQEYGYVQMKGAGRGNGEPHEIFNAQFGPLGKTTMYMTRLNRQARLERAALFYTQQKADQFPALLLRMEIRAQVASQEAQAAVKPLYAELQRKGLTMTEVQQRLRSLTTKHASGPAVMSWQAELGNCVLVIHKASLADGDTCTPTLALVFEDAAFAKLAPNSVQVRRARSRLQQLKDLHGLELADKDLAVGSQDFQVFLAAFVQHKVLSLQLDLDGKAVQYAHLQALMPALAERTVEQSRIVKAIQRLTRAIDAKAQALQGWVMGSFVSPSLLPASFAELKAGCPDWDLKQFHRGIFPWQHQTAELSGKSEVELLTELGLRINEHQRAMEELKLLQEEKEHALELYNRQAGALAKALESMVSAISTQAAGEDSVAESAPDLQMTRAVKRRQGLSILLQEKLRKVEALRACAARSFCLAASPHSNQQAMAEAAVLNALSDIALDEQSYSDMDD